MGNFIFNNRSYGKVTQGDEVQITTDGSVLVNGEIRSPLGFCGRIPFEAQSTTQKEVFMNEHTYRIRQLADELQPPESGKQSVVLTEDKNAEVVLFAFAAGDVLKEHIAPLPAIIQIIKGEAGEEAVAGKPGTWIQMVAKTPHSIKATTPLVVLLTLLKSPYSK